MQALLHRLSPVVRPRHQQPALEMKDGKLTFRYWLYDHVTGKGKRLRHTFPADVPRDKAEREMAVILDRVNGLNTGKSSLPLTVAEFVESHWRAYTRTKNLRRSTLYSYDSILRVHILPAIGSRLLTEVTPDHIAAMFERLIKAKRSPKYRSNIFKLLETMFDLAKESDKIPVSPVRAMLHRSNVPKKKKPALTAEQIRSVIEQTAPEYQTLHWTVALTGVRLGELLALQIRDLDLTLGRIQLERDIWRGEVDELKTEASQGVIPIPPILREMLRAHLERPEFTGPEDFVFCRADGRSLDPDHLRRSVLYPAMKDAGIKRQPREYGYHIFRHSGGRIVYHQTRDLKAAQDMLRHATIATTSDVYLDRDEGVAQEAGEILAREISGKLETDKIQ